MAAILRGAAAGLLTGGLVYYVYREDAENRTAEFQKKFDYMIRRLRLADPTARVATSLTAEVIPTLDSNSGWNGSLRRLSQRLVDTSRLTDSFVLPFAFSDIWQSISGTAENAKQQLAEATKQLKKT